MNSKTQFLQACYRQTSWIAMPDPATPIAVGDVAQIQSGHLRVLLNLTDAHLAGPLLLSRSIPLAGIHWSFMHGVTQSGMQSDARQHDGADIASDAEFISLHQQALNFEQAGDYIFHAGNGHVRYLLNWDQIREDVTLKLSQLHYQFREVMVVVAVTGMLEWGLAIAAKPDGQIAMYSEMEGAEPAGLLGHQASRMIHSRNMAYASVGNTQAMHFFKAKKLCLSDACTDRLLSMLIEKHADRPPHELANCLSSDLINFSRSADLNLNTCAQFFSWQDVTLDDVVKMI